MKLARLRRGLKLSDAELDEQLREAFHPESQLVEATDAGVAFRINDDWIIHIETAHEYLVQLTQLFYDIAPRVLDGSLSTTELTNIRTQLLQSSSSEYYYFSNREVFDVFSSRQKLVFAPPERLRKQINWSLAGHDASWITIRDKTNWAKKQVLAIRKDHVQLKKLTTARQADYIAQGFWRALNLPADRRKAALENLKNNIYLDTRNELGRPKAWAGLPVSPAPHSKAWLQRRDGKWQLWIERAGVPLSVLDTVDGSSVHPPTLPRQKHPWYAVEATPTGYPDYAGIHYVPFETERLDDGLSNEHHGLHGWEQPEETAYLAKRSKRAKSAGDVSTGVLEPAELVHAPIRSRESSGEHDPRVI